MASTRGVRFLTGHPVSRPMATDADGSMVTAVPRSDEIRKTLAVRVAVTILTLLTIPIIVVSDARPAFALTGNTFRPAVAVNPSTGAQWAFFRNTADGQISETWFSGGVWNGPQDMGWQTASAPSIAVDDGNNQWVFWQGTDGNIWEAWYVAGQGWNGPVDKYWAAASAPSVAVNPTNGNQWVFWQNTNGNLSEAWYQGGWYRADYGWAISSAPTVAVDDNGNQWVFYRGTDGNLGEVWYQSGWYGPADFTNFPISSEPSLALNPANDLQWVFYQGSDGNLWEVWYQGGWNGPSDFGNGWTLNSAPGVAADNGGNQWVFWRGTNSDIWEGYYVSGSGWYGPQDRNWTSGYNLENCMWKPPATNTGVTYGTEAPYNTNAQTATANWNTLLSNNAVSFGFATKSNGPIYEHATNFGNTGYDGITNYSCSGGDFTKPVNVYINTYYASTYSTGEQVDVLAHEFGHSLGLGHNWYYDGTDCIGVTLMYPSTDKRWGTCSLQSPTSEDISGAAHIYGTGV
jgi:hypothetical protein